MPKTPEIDIADLLDQVKKVRNRLLKESDVGGVLIASSFIDACLASLLGVYFKKSGVTQKLLNSTSGILGTFSSKCDITYCLNLIAKDTYKDLIKLGEIRNIFAHNHLKANFNNNKIHECCSELKAPEYFLEAHQEQSNLDDLKMYFENPKKRFIYTTSSVSDLLMKQTMSIKSRNRRNGSNV